MALFSKRERQTGWELAADGSLPLTSEAETVRYFRINVSNRPNKAPEPTTTAVTIRAPSSTARASRGRGSSLTFGKTPRNEYRWSEVESTLPLRP